MSTGGPVARERKNPSGAGLSVTQPGESVFTGGSTSTPGPESGRVSLPLTRCKNKKGVRMSRLARCSVAAALAVALLMMPPLAQAQTQWKFVSIIPAGQVFTKVFQELADDLTQQSNGRLQVTLYPAGELPYKGTEYLRTAGRGLVEMAEIVGGFTFGDAPQLVLPDLPYIALNDAEQQTLVADMLPVAETALRAHGVEPIAWGVYPRRQIVMRAPVKGLADFKGKKIRTAGGLEAEYLKVWNAVPSFVVWAEVYPAAQRGIVDGVMTATVAIETAKLYEVAPYFVKIDGPENHFFICVNDRAWKGLPADLQKTVKQVGGQWMQKWERIIVRGEDVKALERMQAKGQVKSVVSLTEAERQQTRQGVIPRLREYIKAKIGPDGVAAYEKLLTDLKLK
jgi:TRAP-type C4-dicarboxylate transport system substrate-binding protein